MTGALSLPAAAWAAPMGIDRAAGREESLTAEERWVAAAARGDRGAFARLVELHKGAVYGLCHRLLRDPEEARDAAQETFARAYAALSAFDAAQPFAPWLLRIARNHALDLLRRRLPAARQVQLDAAGPEGRAPELPDTATPAADDALARSETVSALEQAVEALPERYRAAIHLFHVERLTYKEIASTLEVPIGTVMTWLHRARKQLREAMLREEGQP